MEIVFMYVGKKDREKKIKRREWKNAVKEAVAKFAHDIDYDLFRLEKYRKYLAIAYAAFLILLPQTAFAAGAQGGMSLVILMQKASFWVGLGVTIWGVVEMQLNLPDWKSRIFKGVLGYIFVLVLPLIFLELRDNLQVDVWNKINGR